MELLIDIATYIEPIGPEVTGGEVYERFQREPDTLAIAVVDPDGVPLGLVERNEFLVSMAAQYGHALWARRPIRHVMKLDPVVADGEITIAEFCGRILEERPSELLHGFIVLNGGRYVGVGTALSLLQATATATAHVAARMTTLARQAEEALAAKARFLAVMSHEIRTPLNGVLAVAEILKRKSRQANLAPFIDTILESGGVLLRLLNDALDLSRAEATGMELDKQPMDVSRLLEDARQLWSAQAELRGLDLRIDYAGPDALWVLADRVRLRQVLDNLVGNAIKFTDEGGVSVRLEALEEGQLLRLAASVSDTGPGIPEDRLDQVFEPFHQTDDGMRRGGAGLGLAVCRQIVERMGGRIAARRNPDRGTTFEFEAPLQRLQEGEAAKDASPEPELATNVRVLIADDNAVNRTVAQTLCDLFGCESECVEDGDEAVKAVASGRFDLVLMDIKMPRMDGVEATRRIRSSANPGSVVPILALTANADPGDARIYRAAGMNGVVEKPIKAERLLAAMSEVLALGMEETGSSAAGAASISA